MQESGLIPAQLSWKSFSQFGNLKKHMIVHGSKLHFSCTTCGKSFSQSGGLKKHMMIHTGEQLYICTTYDQSFSQSEQLKNT